MDTPQAADLNTFLAALFEPSDLLEIRTFHSDRRAAKDGDVQRYYRVCREVPALFDKLTLLNTEGEHNIYIGANPRIREGGTKADVAMCRCLFADWDDVEPAAIDGILTDAKLPEPTLIVASGHGVHCYWRLVEPITDLELFRAAQTAIIQRGKCDDKIKDAPRVMRLPGFLNLADPDKDEATVPVTIFRMNAEARYTVEEVAGVVEVPVEVQPAPRVPSNPQDRQAKLAKATLQFLSFGAQPGERNKRLFDAACDLAGNSYTITEASRMLSGPAVASGLTQAEVDGTLNSAFDRPRNPAVPDDTAEIATAFQRLAGIGVEKPAEPLIQPAHLNAARPTVANVVDATKSDGDSVRYYVPLPQIARNINEAMGGWPRRAGGMLFAVSDVPPHRLPEMRDVRWLKKAESLFAWVSQHCDLRWTTNETMHQVRKAPLTPATKSELFAYYVDGPVVAYRAVEILPHEPEMPDLFYLPANLPPAPPTSPDKRTPLQELVSRFNPETEEDRALMLAALLTPGWGGPAGTRPAFVFTSAFGRGTGKTTTASVLADIWGGAITVGVKEDFDKLRGRLLGDEALTKRIAFMDNVKGRMSNGDIEGLITAKVWDGWKPYVGQASRPNTLTWYFTANTPSLSRDLAERSVIIKVGKPAHGTDFVSWAADHIAEHRATILAELFAALRAEPDCIIRRENRDRWGAWQNAVLAKFGNGNELAELCKERRGDVDADSEDADEIAMSVVNLVKEHFPDHQTRRIFFSTKRFYEQLTKDSVIDRSFSVKGFVTWVKERCGMGALACLHQFKARERRGWLYVGESWQPQDQYIDEIKDIETATPWRVGGA